MFNKFIVYYLQNLKFLIIITALSIFIAYYINLFNVEKNRYTLDRYEFTTISELALNKFLPASHIVKLLTPNKLRVSVEGIKDEAAKSSMGLVNQAIFENLLKEITSEAYRLDYMTNNKDLINIDIVDGSVCGQITFKSKFNSEDFNKDKFINFMEKSNNNTKNLLINITGNKEIHNLVDHLYVLKKVEKIYSKEIHYFYIFLIIFFSINYLFFLFFIFRRSKIKIRL
jgi:hypothetical protein